MTCGRSDLALAYFGSARKLSKSVPDIVAGKEVVVTAVQYSAAQEYRNRTDFKSVLRGSQCPVTYIKASLKISGFVPLMEASSRVKPGSETVSKEEIAELVRALKADDRHARIEAAEELALLGQQASPALSALNEALKDTDGLVRVRSAEA